MGLDRPWREGKTQQRCLFSSLRCHDVLGQCWRYGHLCALPTAPLPAVAQLLMGTDTRGHPYSKPPPRKNNMVPSKNARSHLRLPKWQSVLVAEPQMLQTSSPPNCTVPRFSTPGGFLPPPGLPAPASRLAGGGLPAVTPIIK